MNIFTSTLSIQDCMSFTRFNDRKLIPTVYDYSSFDVAKYDGSNAELSENNNSIITYSNMEARYRTFVI